MLDGEESDDEEKNQKASKMIPTLRNDSMNVHMTNQAADNDDEGGDLNDIDIHSDNTRHILNISEKRLPVSVTVLQQNGITDIFTVHKTKIKQNINNITTVKTVNINSNNTSNANDKDIRNNNNHKNVIKLSKSDFAMQLIKDKKRL